MDRPVYSLHLFAGAGGGILADILAGVQPVCAVEIEDYPRRVLQLRFPGLPVWDDVCTFRADNPDCADAFAWLREHRDGLCISGGFPCQDVSSAGRGKGVRHGERSGLWREFARIIGEIRPGFCFVENSPMLVGRGLDLVLTDLAARGYSAVWRIVSAADVGARHKRDRIWICARRNDLAGGGDEWPTPTIASISNNPFGGAGFGLGTAVKFRAGPWTHPELERRGFPTPNATDYKHSVNERVGRQKMLIHAVRELFPTPTRHDSTGAHPSEMNRHSPNLAAVAQFQTPTASEDHARLHGDSQASKMLSSVVRLSFPTCGCRNMGGASCSFGKLRDLADAGAITEDERRNMASGGQLNPDWVEWLMGWPVGWTDVSRAVCDWLPLPDDPADLPREDAGFVPRITTRRENRAARIRAIGNGQVPLCAAVAAEEGFAILAALASLSQPNPNPTKP